MQWPVKRQCQRQICTMAVALKMILIHLVRFCPLRKKMWAMLLSSSINITWFNEIFAPASFFTSIDMLSFRFILKSLQPVWSSMKISVLLPKIRWCWQYLGGKYWWFWGSMGDLLWTQISQFCKIWFQTLQSPIHHFSFPHLTSFSAQMKPEKII